VFLDVASALLWFEGLANHGRSPRLCDSSVSMKKPFTGPMLTRLGARAVLVASGRGVDKFFQDTRHSPDWRVVKFMYFHLPSKETTSEKYRKSQ
jgi:hypothetical protein